MIRSCPSPTPAGATHLISGYRLGASQFAHPEFPSTFPPIVQVATAPAPPPPEKLIFGADVYPLPPETNVIAITAPPPEIIDFADAALPLPPDNDIVGSPQGQISERVHDIQVTVHKIDEFRNTFGFFDRKDPYVLLQLGREKQNTSCKNDVRTCEKSRFYLVSCAVAGS
jgi:hypothetical protein